MWKKKEGLSGKEKDSIQPSNVCLNMGFFTIKYLHKYIRWPIYLG